MPFGEKLSELRRARGLTRKQLVEMLDPPVTEQACYNWEKQGQLAKMPVLKQLAEILGVSVGELLDEDAMGSKPVPSMATLPVMRLGFVHAGEPEEGYEELGVVQCPEDLVKRHPHARFLEVRGDCMDLTFPEGCMILVDPDMSPRNGQPVVAMIGGEYVLREYHRFRDTLVLSSNSHAGDYPDIVIRDPEADVRIYGTVVWFQSADDLRP